MLTVHIHRKNVRKACFRIGLYFQGLTHDLSKYAPSEFILSVKYYDGTKSPNAIDRRLNGCSRAWLHHKGRNRHHYEYWIDFMGEPVNGPFGCKMPLKYVAEMVCDRRAACIAYHGSSYTQADPYNYYVKTLEHVIMHPDTRFVLETALIKMRDSGDEAAFAFLKKALSVTKGTDYTRETISAIL
ncbi:MAG: catalase [Lachnospiraceae bacterium]|nr:catalase [Candidatus Hippenecus merdae]